MKTTLLVLSLLTSAPAFAVDYNCHDPEGASFVLHAPIPTRLGYAGSADWNRPTGSVHFSASQFSPDAFALANAESNGAFRVLPAANQPLPRPPRNCGRALCDLAQEFPQIRAQLEFPDQTVSLVCD